MPREQYGEGGRSRLVLNAARYHALVIVAFAAVGVVLAVLFLQVRPATYVATASVLVNPVQGNAFAPDQSGDDLVTLETEAEVVESDAVTTLAMARLPGVRDRQAVRNGVSVVVPTNTQVLEVSSAARGPEQARRQANAYAASYLQFRSQQAARSAATREAAIEEQIAQVTDDLRTATTAAGGAQSSDEQAFQEQVVSALNGELADLRAARVDLQAVTAPVGRVISPAQAPERPAGPDHRLVLAAGLLAGLLAGFGVAVLREYRVGAVRGRADVEALGVPVVATLRRRGLLDLPEPEDVADQVRHLRALVVAGAPAPTVLAISACARGVLEPGITARLGLALWRSGHRVVLVDAARGGLDPYESDPSGAVGHARSPGLSEWLLEDRHPVEGYLVPVGEGMRLLPRGARYDEALDRFEPPRLTRLLTELGARADFVVLRCPPVPEAAGRAALAAVRHVLLVVVPGATTSDDVEAAVAAARAAGARVLGAVVSAPAPRRARTARRARKGRAPLPLAQGGDAALRGGPTSHPSPT